MDPLRHLRTERRYHAGLAGDTMDERARAMDLVLLATARPGSGSVILDLGCGCGYLRHTALACYDGISIKSMDIDESFRPPIVADARYMPFPDESFSIVLAQESLSFVDGLEKALSEIRRVLVPNGLLVFGDYSFDTADQAKAWHPIVNRLNENEWHHVMDQYGLMVEATTYHESAVIRSWWQTYTALEGRETLKGRRENLGQRISVMKSGRANRFIKTARKTNG